MNKIPKILQYFLKALIFSAVLLLLTILISHFMIPEIVDVTTIRINPESTKGYIGVIGKIKALDKTADYFLIEDRRLKCKVIPVTYKGRMLKANTEIIAYGHFRKIDGSLDKDMLWWEYILEAGKIKTTDEMLSGFALYTFRQKIHTFLNNCAICRKIKNRIVSVFPFN